MINSDMISQTKEMLRRSNLEKMRACYLEYSNDWDAQVECREYEKRICTLQSKSRGSAWTQDVYALRSVRLSAAAVKYFSLADSLDAMVKEADDIVAKERAAYVATCRERACAVDKSIRELLAREISLQWCTELTELYGEVSGLPGDVKQYSMCIEKLEKAYENRGVTEKAARFDDAVGQVGAITNVNSRFSSARELLREYGSFSAEERSLCKKRGALEDIIRICSTEIEKIRVERQEKAEAIDGQFDGFAGTLSDERITQAREFVKKYNHTPAEIRAFCQHATDVAMKKFEVRLDQNQKENELRAKAADIDSRFSALASIKRERTYFSKAEAIIAEIRSTSSDVLQFCGVASRQAVNRLENAIKVEKKYLDYEKQINELSNSKTHTTEWCKRVWQAFSLILPDIDKCRNSQLLRELNKKANQIDIEIVCEPYLEALRTDSDFKKVLELDAGLNTFADKEKLDKGIASFDTKWKQRVEWAHSQARQKADETYEQAEELYIHSKYDRSFSLFIEADRYGNPDAAYYIGRHYWLGNGVKKDISKAKLYLEKSASNGNEYAMSDLADIYEDAKNVQMEFYWRKRAVEAGFDSDILRLAKMYYEGIGTAQSYSKARKLFEELVDNVIYGAEANAYLGRIYENALGVNKNEQLALEHYGKAESIPWAKEAHDKLFHKLDEEKRDREIIENFERAKAGDPWAQYFIGWCYYNGYRTEKSYFMALLWLEKAAKGGIGKAMAILGDMYYNGEGVAVDKSKAKEYYKDALLHGEQ